MADQTPKRGGIFARRKTIGKTFLRFLGFKKVRYGSEANIQDMGSYRELENMRVFGQSFFDVVGQINKNMVETERRWDGGPGYEELNASLKKSQVIELYSKLGSKKEISSSIGPFTNRAALELEGKIANQGTGFVGYDEIPFSISLRHVTPGANPNGLKFSLPKDITIKHNERREYKVAYFGYRRSPYWSTLERDINEICDKVKERGTLSLNDEQKQIFSANIEFIRKKIQAFRDVLADELGSFDESHRSALTGEEGVLGLHNTAERRFRPQLLGLALDDNQVYYTHTYKIIQPKVYKDGLLEAELPESFKQGDEVAPGLDKNGYPLEVGDGKTFFSGRGSRELMEEGVVLIDFYEGRSPNGGEVRKVSPQFITDVDLLDLAVWIYTAHDAYRDDLRDGRYHEKSISIMELIMSELKVKGHPQSLSDIKNGNHAKINMKLNKLPAALEATSLRPSSDPNSVKMTIEPSHLNPAFDLRAPGRTLHRGRKYYYDLQENIFNEQSKEPTITTRGAALYILHRVIQDTKYWGGMNDPNRTGVIEVLEAIGRIINGYDIGPNIGYYMEKGEAKLKVWGKDLPINPFRPKRGT